MAGRQRLRDALGRRESQRGFFFFGLWLVAKEVFVFLELWLVASGLEMKCDQEKANEVLL